MLIGLVASCVASGFVTNDELKAQLLSEYRLLTTHPAAAAAQLGLDENGQQAVNQTCGATIRQPATQVSLQIYIERYHLVVENAEKDQTRDIILKTEHFVSVFNMRSHVFNMRSNIQNC